MPKPEIPSGFAAKIGNGFFLTVAGSAMIVITMGCGDACPVYPGKR